MICERAYIMGYKICTPEMKKDRMRNKGQVTSPARVELGLGASGIGVKLSGTNGVG